MAEKPTLIAYTVRNFLKDGQEDSVWLKIGAGWIHKDDKGFDVKLDASPIDGRIVLRLNEPKPDKEAPALAPPDDK